MNIPATIKTTDKAAAHNRIALVVLLLLTALTWGLAEDGRLTTLTILLVVSAMTVKFMLIVLNYMELNTAHAAWQILFALYVLTLAVTFGAVF